MAIGFLAMGIARYCLVNEVFCHNYSYNTLHSMFYNPERDDNSIDTKFIFDKSRRDGTEYQSRQVADNYRFKIT